MLSNSSTETTSSTEEIISSHSSSSTASSTSDILTQSPSSSATISSSSSVSILGELQPENKNTNQKSKLKKNLPLKVDNYAIQDKKPFQSDGHDKYDTYFKNLLEAKLSCKVLDFNEIVGNGVQFITQLPTISQLEDKTFEPVTNFLTYAFENHEAKIIQIQKQKKVTREADIADLQKKLQTKNLELKTINQEIEPVSAKLTEINKKLKVKGLPSTESKPLKKVKQQVQAELKKLNAIKNELTAVVKTLTSQSKEALFDPKKSMEKFPATCVGFTIISDEKGNEFCLVGCSGSSEKSQEEYKLLEEIAKQQNGKLGKNYFLVITPPDHSATNSNLLHAKYYLADSKENLDEQQIKTLFSKMCYERSVFHLLAKIRHQTSIKVLGFATCKFYPYPQKDMEDLALKENCIESIPKQDAVSLPKGNHQFVFFPLCPTCKILTNSYLNKIAYAANQPSTAQDQEPLSPIAENISKGMNLGKVSSST